MDIKEQLKNVFPRGDHYYRDQRLELSKLDNGYEITYGEMYEAPEINLFDLLTGLSALFGTTKITMDNYGHGGCESCDWGSEYGHTIQIREPTKNLEEFDKIVKEGNLYKGRR